MLLKKIKLTNFAQHKNIEKDLTGNLIGVLGANGCGKSNFLGAIQFAFVGDTGDPESTKDSLITDGLAGKDRKGWVEVWFEAHGKEGYIKRALHSQTREFKYGDEVYKKDKEIDKALQAIFGMDKDMLRNLTFIQQGELQKLLFGKAAEREANFVKIFGLAHTEAIRQTLYGATQFLETVAVDHTVALDERKMAMNKAVEDRNALQALVAATESVPAEYAAAEKDLQGALTANRLLDDLAAAEKLVKEYSARLHDLRASPANIDLASLPSTKQVLEEVQARISRNQSIISAVSGKRAMQDSLNNQDRLLAEASAAMRVAAEKKSSLKPVSESRVQFDAYLKTIDAIAVLESERSTLLQDSLSAEKEVAEHAEKVALFNKTPFDYAELDKLEHAVNKGRSDVELLEELLRNLSDEDSGKFKCCPLCQHDVSNSEELLSNIRARHAAGKAALDKISEELRAMDAKEKANSAADRDLKFRSSVLSERSSSIKSRMTKCVELIQTKLDATAVMFPGWVAPTKENWRLVSRDSVMEALKLLDEHDALAEHCMRLALNYDALSNTKNALLEQMKSFAGVPDVAPDVSRDQAEVLQLQAKINAAESFKTLLDQAEGNLQAAMKDQVSKAAAAAGLVRVPPETVQQLQTSKTLRMAALDSRNQLLGQIAAAQGAIDDHQRRLAELQTEADKARNIVALREHFDKVRDILSRDKLPLTFIQQYFVRLVPLIQRNLGLVGANYIVRMAKDEMVNFVFDRHDGTCSDLPISKLSGGQKVRLVVAFLLALHELMSSRMGFLILDEPTVFLDDQGVESFGELLSDIIRRLQAANMQILISTHESSLKSSFSSTIVLDHAV